MNPISTLPPADPPAEPAAPSAAPVLFPNLRRAMPLTLLLTALALLGLQMWRPYYFLTDDNLTGVYPVASEIMRHLAAGESITTLDSIFGGGYPWTRDIAAVTTLCGPYQILCSWLLLTPADLAFVDIVSSLIMLTIAGAFCWSALALRRRLNLAVSDGWIVFLSLSYTFTPFNLMTGPAWLGFLNAQAAAPVILVALLHPSWRRGVLLVAGSLIFSIFGGHLHPSSYLGLFMGFFSLGLAWTSKSLRPLLVLAGGAFIAFLCVLPLAIPALAGYAESTRTGTFTLAYSQFLSVRATALLPSFVGGPISVFVAPLHFLLDSYKETIPMVAFAASNVVFLVILATKRKWNSLDVLVAAGFVLALIFITRPIWLATAMQHLPIFRSLRWPFREISILLFFSHIFVLLNVPRINVRLARLTALVGALLYSPILLHRAPTYNPMSLDRALILSGVAQDFWAKFTKQYGKRPLIISSLGVLPRDFGVRDVPHSLLGAYNYPCVLGITNVYGYSPTTPKTRFSTDVPPMRLGGVFWWKEAERVREAHPEVLHVSLRAIEPTIFTIREGEKEWAFRFDSRTLEVREIPAKTAAAVSSPEPGQPIDTAPPVEAPAPSLPK